MQDKNELSDIVLNKSEVSNSKKKTILAVATLGIVLIIVVLLMKPSSSEQDDMMQPVPPKPQSALIANNDDTQESTLKDEPQEPLFEEVEVIEEEPATEADLDQIAQKLKEESRQESVAAVESVTKVVQEAPSKVVAKTKAVTKKVATTPKKRVTSANKAVAQGHYYIQVGSFSKYEPNKKFINSITSLGYNYKYHKVGNLNKVLVGPFPTRDEANRAKKVLRSKVEPGAFLVKL
jgi:DedD protein